MFGRTSPDALGSPTNDFLDFPRHFLSPKFRLFWRKSSFSKATPDSVNHVSPWRFLTVENFASGSVLSPRPPTRTVLRSLAEGATLLLASRCGAHLGCSPHFVDLSISQSSAANLVPAAYIAQGLLYMSGVAMYGKDQHSFWSADDPGCENLRSTGSTHRPSSG
jgi:hypothetical protein